MTFAMCAVNELQQARAQKLDFVAQLDILESVGARLRPHNDVDRWACAGTPHQIEEPKTAELSQAPLESVALDGGVAVLRNDETNSGRRARGKNHPQIEVGGAETLAVPHRGAQVATASQPMPPP